MSGRGAILLLFAAAFAACMPKHVITNQGVGVGAALGPVVDGPFRLLFAGPKGESPGDSRITLAFSRSVRGPEAPAKIVRDSDGQPIEGAWLWFGESTAIFEPRTPLPTASTFRVEPQPLTGTDGSTLPAGAPFTFSTRRPELLTVRYEHDEKKDLHLVQLSFDQPVAPTAAAIRIEGRDALDRPARALGFRFVDPSPAREVTLEVDAAVARLEDVNVIATTALRASSGPLGPTSEMRLPLESVGPFKMELACSGPDAKEREPMRLPASTTPTCNDEDSIRLEFSRAVKTRDLLRHLVVVAPSKANPDELKALNDRGSDDETYSLDLGALFAATPGQKYKLTIKAGLVTGDKERLGTDQPLELETLDRRPSLTWRDLQSENSVVESSRPALDLGLHVTNVPKFETTTAPLGEDDVARFFFPEGAKPNAAWVHARAKSTSNVIDVVSKKNVGTSEKIRVAAGRAPGAAGAYAVATHAAGLEDDVRLLSITDLGVNAKWSPHGSLLWVTRLSSAEPVQGATISLRHVGPGAIGEAFTTTTDREGLATIPAAAHAPFLRAGPIDKAKDGALVVVKLGADWTYLRLPELDPSLMAAMGDVFVERALYRAGETVFAKGYFRLPGPKGLASLAGTTAFVEALDSGDRVFSAETVTLDAFGGFSTQIAIPRNIRLGRGYLRARVGTAEPTEPSRPGGRWSRDRHWPARAGFLVDAFRTPEFKVELKGEHPSVVRGAPTTLTATAVYLAGPPLAGVPVNVAVSRSMSRFVPPGLAEEGFSVVPGPFLEEEGRESRGKTPEAPSGKLDDAGHYRFTYATLAGSAVAMPETYSFDVDVADVSKAFSMADRFEVLVHPSDVYLGVRFQAPDQPLIPGKRIRAEVIAAGIDGARRGGIPTRLELYRAQSKGPPVATGRSCNVTTEAAKVSGCDLGVADEGQHWIKASARDASGRELVSEHGFAVLPKNTRPAPPPKVEPAPPPAPAISFDDACKQSPTTSAHDGLRVENWRYLEWFPYGQNVHLCLHSREDQPKSARGLFTIEREGILRREPILDFHASPWKLLNLPLTDDLFPNAELTLVEEVGRSTPFPTTEGAGDAGHPFSNHTSQRLLVAAPPSKKLAVTLDTPKEASPGAEIEVQVHVNDGDGRPTAAQVTLWAVDEGIQLLVPYNVPKLSEVFHDDRPADVVERDTRSEIYFERGSTHRVKAPSLRQGATSVGDRTLIGRSVFRPTAFFFPNVVTNERGVATVRAKLPDNLTTWNVFAVAATTTDAFGEGTASFPTNKTLMVRPQLPRFLRAGDRFEATVVVDSLLERAIELRLTASAAGVLEVKGGPITAKIPAKGHVPLQIAVEARAAGAGAITFHTTVPNGPEDRVTVTEEVASIASLETSAIAGEVVGKTVVKEPIGDLGAVSPDVGGFDVRLSTTPLVGLADSMNGLLEYPYGCTEQLTSRLVPLMRLRSLAHEIGVALPANVDGSVRSSLASLLSHQQPDGGFGFWRESKKSDAWLTLLAFDALQTAEAHGYPVPRSALAQARAFLESSKTPLDLPSQALLEDLLAAANGPRVDKLRALAAERTLPLHAQALVAHGLASVDPPLAKQLLAAITAQAQVSGTSITFVESSPSYLASNARTTALVLRALLAIELRSPLVPKVVRGLLSLRRAGRWPTTQDSAWALGALEAARVLYAIEPGPMQLHVGFAHQRQAMASFAGVAGGETLAATIPMSRLLRSPGAAVELESDGTRPLYYEGALRYARRAPPTSPLEHGLSIARSLRPLNPERPELHVGDYVVSDVVIVSTTPRDQVVIDDPIPAGFEAVNETFAAMDRAPILADLATHLTHRELHDDRVVSFFDALPAGVQRTRYVLRVVAKGRFAHPPAKAECMYAPDVFGRTASMWIETR